MNRSSSREPRPDRRRSLATRPGSKFTLGRRTGIFLALFLTSSVAWSEASGQQATIRAERGPHYAGVPVTFELVMRGFSVKPICQPEAPEGTFITEGGSTRMSIDFSRSYNISQSYRFVAPAPGTYTIGPFEVEAGTVKKKTNTITLSLKPVPIDEFLEIKVQLPEKPLTIGQRTPVTVEVWCREDRFRVIQQTSLTITVPLFDRLEEFTFVDPPVRRGESALDINTSHGPVRLPILTERRKRGRETWYRISCARTLIPRRAGTFEIPPAIVNTYRAQDRRPIPILARDLERTVVVAELPAGKPASWAGAIGRGLSLEVSADRTVVQVGDPIRLTLELKGDGNLENASLPPLSADGGLDPDRFRLPTGDVSGVFADGVKTFEVTVRAMDERITEIPPIAYSWYDAELGRYETTRSRPIALSVRGANIVSAEDVIGSGIDSESDPAASNPESASVTGPSTTTRSFTLSGADLAHVDEIDRLLQPMHREWAPIATYSLYGVPLLAIALALVARRRAAIDPAIVRRRKLFAASLAEIRGCRGKPEVEATEAIAAALRRMLSEAPAARTPEHDAFLAECEAVVYAPSGGTDAVSAPFVERAIALAESIEQASR